MSDHNYTVIQSFMINDLKLKGNELLIYAIIYGFSQTNEQYYNGSLNYLCLWTKTSKQTIINVLKKLVNEKLIIKSETTINNVKICKYSINQEKLNYVDFRQNETKKYINKVMELKLNNDEFKNFLQATTFNEIEQQILLEEYCKQTNFK